MLSFYSNFWLNYFYFLKSCPIDGYMKLHVIGEIIYSLYRIILQEKEILFACNRRLEEQVQQISQQTAEFTVLGKNLQCHKMNVMQIFLWINLKKYQHISHQKIFQRFYLPIQSIMRNGGIYKGLL